MIIKYLFCLILTALVFVVNPVFAQAATLSLNPATGTFNRGCSFSLNIELDTGGVQTDGTDAILKYDPTRFTAISITNGTIYPDYPGNSIDAQTGRINVSGLASPSQAFSSKGTLATINFVATQSAPTGTTPVTFDFDPNNKAKTTDSNVVERGTIVDVLSAVTNGNYTVGSGACGSGTSTTTTTTTGGQGQTGTSTSLTSGGSKGGVGDSSTSGVPLKDLNPGGTSPGLTGPTMVLAVVGGFLTIVGILGLAIL